MVKIVGILALVGTVLGVIFLIVAGVTAAHSAGFGSTAAPATAGLELWVVPIVFGGLGLVFTALGAVGLVIMARQARRSAWLRRHGERVLARIEGARPVQNVWINGRHPWRLTAVWQDPGTGQVHSFHSASLMYNPVDALGGVDTVPVLIDPADPQRRHWIDLAAVGITD